MTRSTRKSAGKNGSGKKASKGLGELEPSSSISGWPGTPSRMPPTSREGEKVGRYKLKKMVGRGGMGVVFDAYDSRLHRSVAIKLLPEHLLENRERRARFLREARLVAKLNHPNIVSVYEVGETDREIFIVMERLDGHSLRRKMEDFPNGLPLPEAVRIARDIAKGVGEAHKRGVIHRDIKPENVLICRDGVVKLLDFGLAKAFSADDAASASATTDIATGEGVVAGTAAYMAPEQARGETLDARADVFALGVVLYEMLAGNRPFLGKTNFEIQAALLRDAPAPLRNVPTGLEQIVLHCLDKRPDARFADAEALATALDVATWVHKRRLSKKGLWMIAAAIVFLLSLLVVRRLVTAPVTLETLRKLEIEIHPKAVVRRLVTEPVTLETLPRPKFENHDDAKYAYNQALVDMRRAKWGDAEVELRKALAAYPTINIVNLSELLEKNPKKALEEIEDVLKQHPDVATLHARMALAKMDHFATDKEGMVHHRIASAPPAQLSSYDRDLMKALSPMFEPKKPQIKETIQNLEDMKKDYSEYAELFLFLASFYRYDSADKRKEAAVIARTLDPSYADALQMEAVAVFEENPVEALDILRKCADKPDAASDCLGERGRLENLQGACLKAEKDVGLALNRVSPSSWILNLYPHLLYRNKMNAELFWRGYDEQWKKFMRGKEDTAQKKSPIDLNSYERAKFEAAYGHFATAKKILEKLSKPKPHSTEIEWMLVEIARETGDLKTAAKDLVNT